MRIQDDNERQQLLDAVAFNQEASSQPLPKTLKVRLF